ncbi:MAG: hypothetical protein WCX86_04735 [Candidatus Hydrogenedentales bacterium]
MNKGGEIQKKEGKPEEGTRSRRIAIQKYYLWLHCENHRTVKNCPMTGHPLWPYRMGSVLPPDPTKRRRPDPITGKDYRVDLPLSPATAIGAACRLCAENAEEVRHCAFLECPLWAYRSGAPEKGDLFFVSGGSAAKAYPSKDENDSLKQPAKSDSLGGSYEHTKKS